ncbi:hypothetical protein KEJ18_01240 [Candidatus Bathyarchaeota archaeon]|nr:hypothetical protein [Candidatus Bathyarchaeota archaeon]
MGSEIKELISELRALYVLVRGVLFFIFLMFIGELVATPENTINCFVD